MGRPFIFIICCINSITGCAAEKIESLTLDRKTPPPPITIHLEVPKDAIQIASSPQNVNIVIPEESIKVNIPKQLLEIDYPEKLFNITVATPQVMVNIPSDAIKVTLPVQQQNLVIPEEAVVVNLVRSPLIWLTLVFSLLTFFLSLATYKDKVKKDKKDDKKSLMDDFWYRTVIHSECTKIINNLYEVLAIQLKTKPFKQINHASSFAVIHDSLAKLDQLSILPNGDLTCLEISKLLQTVEEQITAYTLLNDGSATVEELIAQETPVPELLLEDKPENFCANIKKNIFVLLLDFHTQLGHRI
jgi:hypothetical protein